MSESGPDAIIRDRNTLRAMLRDTRDLLALLQYASDTDRKAASLQMEAIDELLTDGAHSV